MTRFGVRRPRYGRFIAVCTQVITNYPKDPAKDPAFFGSNSTRNSMEFHHRTIVLVPTLLLRKQRQ